MATLAELQNRAKKTFSLADLQRGQQAKAIETQTAERQSESQGKTDEDAVPKLFGSGFFGKLGNAITEAEQVTGKALSIFDKGLTKKLDDTAEQSRKSRERLLKLIREKRARGEDTAKEKAILKSMGQDIIERGDQQGLDLTDRQVAGGVAGTAIDIGAAAAGPLAGKFVAKGSKAPTFASRFLSGGARTAAVSAPEILSKSATGVVIEDEKIKENVPRIAAETAVGTGLAFLLGGITSGVAGSLRQRAENRRAVQEAIEAGDITDAKTAKFITKSADKVDDAAVKIKSDKAAQEAIRQGVPERDVALLKALDDTDIDVARDMTRLAEKASRDRTVIKRPMDIAGETAIKPARHISEKLKSQADELDVIAKGLKGKQVTGYDDLVTKVQDDILDFGGSVTDDGVDFADSAFEDLGGNTKIIKNVYRRLENANDASDLHRLKRYIDANVEYGKSAEGLVGDAERVLKGWRRAIDQSLDGQFSDYKAVNDGLSESIGALDDLSKVMGRKFRLSDPMADIRAGQVSSRLLSNSPNRGEVLQALSTIDDVARSNGYAGKGDVVMQVNVADILEDIYGTQATRSFRGNIERAVDPTMINRARQGDLGIGEAAVKGTVNLLDRSRNISQEGKEAAIKSIIGLSDDLPKTKVPASVGESIGDSMVENMRLAAEKAGKKSLAAKLAKVDTKGVTTASGLEERVMKAVGAGNMSQMEVKNWIKTASQVFDDQAAKAGKSLTSNLAKNSQGGFLNIGGKTKLSSSDYDTLIKYVDHVQGVKKLPKGEVTEVAGRAQDIADALGLDGSGTSKTFAKRLVEFLDAQNFGSSGGFQLRKLNAPLTDIEPGIQNFDAFNK